MKNLIQLFFFVLILSSTESFCQQKYIQDYIRVSNTILLPEKYSDDKKMIFCVDEENVIFLLYTQLYKSENKYYYELYNTKTSSIIRIILPDSISIKSIPVSDFDIKNDILSLIIHNSYFIIFKYNEGIYSPDYIYPVGNYTDTKIINNNAVAFTSNIYTGTQILKVNFENNYKVESYSFPNPKGIEFTFFQPKHLLDINDDYIAIANLSSFHIDFYNWDFTKIDSIYSMPDKWEVGKKAKSHFEDLDFQANPKNANYLIDYLRPILFDFSMIHKIYFISSDLFLILWSNPDEKRMYDYQFALYEKKESRWTEVSDNLINISIDEDDKFKDIINKWKLSNMFKVKGNCLLLVEPIPFELNKDIQELPFSKVKERLEKHFIDNELRYTLVIFRLTK